MFVGREVVSQGDGFPHIAQHLILDVWRKFGVSVAKRLQRKVLVGCERADAADKSFERVLCAREAACEYDSICKRCLMHDDGTCGEVSQTLAPLGEEHHSEPERVGSGEQVNKAQNVAQERGGRSDGRPVPHPDTDAKDSLARRLPIPEQFEEEVVSERDHQQADQKNRHAKRRREIREYAGAHPQEVRVQQKDEEVYQESPNPASKPRDPVFEDGFLRRQHRIILKHPSSDRVPIRQRPMVFRTPFFVLMSVTLVFSLLGTVDGRFLALIWPYNGLLLVLAVLSYLSAPRQDRLRIERQMDKVLSVSTQNLVRLSVVNESDEPMWCRLRDEPPDGFEADNQEFVVSLLPRERVELRYHVTPKERGTFVFRDTFFESVGLLGLAARRGTLKTRQAVTVYPNVLALRKFDLLKQRGHLREIGIRRSRLKSLGTEFESLREYVLGDDYRRIDWKATARRSKLVVREYEAERNQSVILMLDYGRLMMAEVEGRLKLDCVLDATLLLGNAVVHANDQLGLLLYGDMVERWLPPRRGKAQLGHVLQAIHALQAQPIASDLPAAVNYLATRWKRRSLVITFTEVDQAETAKALLPVLAPLAKTHLCLVVTVRDPQTGALARSADLFEATAAQLLAEEREAAAYYMRQAGVHTLDAEPQDLAVALVNYYLDVKATAQL